MFLLRIAENWSSRISEIRDVKTDETHLIRFDNTFYRLCRPGPETFSVEVVPGTGRVNDGITLTLRVRDLYVTHIGTRLFGRYASTIDRLVPQALSLDQAVHELPTAQGDRLFEWQSMLVFCVAESLRNDLIATAVGQMIGATRGDPLLRGPAVHLPMGHHLPVARAPGGKPATPSSRRCLPRPRGRTPTPIRAVAGGTPVLRAGGFDQNPSEPGSGRPIDQGAQATRLRRRRRSPGLRGSGEISSCAFCCCWSCWPSSA